MRTRTYSVVATLAGVIVGLMFLASAMAYAQAPAGPNRPALVPEEYVITPFGYFHPSCVVHVGEGEMLLADGRVLQHANGTLTNVPVCEYPHYTARGEEIAAGAKIEPPTISHSWIVSGGTTTSTSYGEISATWTVPSAPTSGNGQTIYFFPGLEDYQHVVSIIQPVLGWNADFSGSWGIASWNCCPSGTADESSPVRVNQGDPIVGTVKSTCGAGTLSCSKWNITTQDQYLGKSTTLSNTPSEGQTFNWAFAGALEVYNVAQCSNYPPNGSLAFNVTLYDNSFRVISNPGWSITNWASGLTPQCNYGGQVAPAQVTLDFGTVGGPPWKFSVGIPRNNPCYSPGTYSFTLNQQYNSNSLQWTSNVTTNQTQTISVNWTLSDNNGTLLVDSFGSGYSGSRNYTAPRVPVGTPTLYVNASILQLYTGCDAQFQETLTGTH
jgi:hypothetical protein